MMILTIVRSLATICIVSFAAAIVVMLWGGP